MIFCTGFNQGLQRPGDGWEEEWLIQVGRAIWEGAALGVIFQALV
jgi:hypothetical protein